MSRIRNLLADLIVGVVLVLVTLWVLRRLFGTLLWLINAVAFVLVVVVLLAVAGRIRGRKKKIGY